MRQSIDKNIFFGYPAAIDRSRFVLTLVDKTGLIGIDESRFVRDQVEGV